MTKVVIDWTKTFCLKLCVITNRDKSVQVARNMVLTRAVCRRHLLCVRSDRVLWNGLWLACLLRGISVLIDTSL